MLISFRRVAGTLAIAALGTAPVLAQEQPKQPTVKAGGSSVQPAGQPGARPSSAKQQQPNRPLLRTANKPVANQSAADVDQMIAGMLALCNEQEAAVGKFAAEHTQNNEVKKFAATMAQDHAMMAKQLQKWAPEATLSNREAESIKPTTNGTMSFDPLLVHQQIAQRSIASAEKSLGSKKGDDFDMAYVGSQCVLHQQMIDKAFVLRQYSSPELQSAIDKGIASAESHLTHAQQLIEKLADAEKDSK